MSSAFNTIQAANNGITSITKLVQSAQALVSQAQQTSDSTVRSNLATQFGSILSQIDQLSSDSGFNGINLLDSGNSTNLTVTLNETGTSTVTVNAVNFTSSGLSINNATNNWGGASDPISRAPSGVSSWACRIQPICSCGSAGIPDPGGTSENRLLSTVPPKMSA